MSTITISPVTRIEGHAKITVETDDAGHVTDAALNVASFRGFEKFLQGTAMERLPILTSRICGICPLAHQLTSVKAIENALHVTVSAPATKLRELLLLGQFLASHVVSLGVLSLPDLLIPEAPLEKRNLMGLMEVDPKLVDAVMEIRKLGIAFFETVGGREIHAVSCVIGGMSKSLTEDERRDLLKKLLLAEPAMHRLMDAVRSLMKEPTHRDYLGNLPSLHFGLTRDGSVTFYDGQLALADSTGQRVATFDDTDYFDYVEERVESTSYMKFPTLKDGRWFRVGPLARLNLNDRFSTPWAQKELEIYRETCDYPAHETLLFHYARMIETVYVWERAQELLQDPDITSSDVWMPVQPRAGSGIGVIEAPRGTLIHHYLLNEEGYATKVNLIVATQHNNDAINRTLMDVATHTIPERTSEATLNQLEMIVRAYDPCLSCATH